MASSSWAQTTRADGSLLPTSKPHSRPTTAKSNNTNARSTRTNLNTKHSQQPNDTSLPSTTHHSAHPPLTIVLQHAARHLATHHAKLPWPKKLRFKLRRFGDPADAAPLLDGPFDRAGVANLAAEHGLAVGESYAAAVATASSQAPLERGAPVVFQLRPEGSRVLLHVARLTRAVGVKLGWKLPADDHWAASLAPPAGMLLHVQHAATGVHVCSIEASRDGRANLPEELCVGEEYMLEAEASAHSRAASARLMLERGDSGALVHVALERLTAGVTLALTYAGAARADGSVPKDAGYSLRHVALDREVASGVTDASGMAALQEAHTLFVGEIYRVHACGTNSRHFTVAAGSQTLELAVPRGSGTARVHFAAHAASSDHWSAQLSLPARVDFEIRSRGGGGAVLHRGSSEPNGSSNTATATVESSLLFADGEYVVVVPATEYYAAARAELAVQPDGTLWCELRLQRQPASLAVTLASEAAAAAGTAHAVSATARLPPPRDVAFRVLHASLGRIVWQGATRGDPSTVVSGLLVGEAYQLELAPDSRLEASAPIVVSVSAQVSALRLNVRRATTTVEAALVSTKAASSHWSAALPLPGDLPVRAVHRASGLLAGGGLCLSRQNHVCRLSPPPDEAGGVQLVVGEEYVLSVAATDRTQAASVLFVAAAASAPQRVTLGVPLATGKITVRLTLPDATLGPPPSVRLHLSHAALGVSVAPPVALAGDVTELFGDDTLFVGHEYILEATGRTGLLSSSTTFVVERVMTNVELILAREPSPVDLVFRMAAPRRARRVVAATASSAASATHAFLQQHQQQLELPAGICFEIEHKASGRLVVAGQTSERSTEPRVRLCGDGAQPPPLYSLEAYVLRVLGSDIVRPASCEFLAPGGQGGDVHVVALEVERVLGSVAIRVVPSESAAGHWEEALPAPSDVPFEVLHIGSGTIVFRGGSATQPGRLRGAAVATTRPTRGAAEPISLPRDARLFVGERYLLRTWGTALLRDAAVEFFVLAGETTLVSLPIERKLGAVNLQVRLCEGVPPPTTGVECEVLHRKTKRLVAAGVARAARGSSSAPCELAFVDGGAIYVGEEYLACIAPASLHGSAPVPFIAAEAPQLVTLQLTLVGDRSVVSGGGAVVRLVVRPGVSPLERALPLPGSIHVRVRLPDDEGGAILGALTASVGGAQNEHELRLNGAVGLTAPGRYIVAVEPIEASPHVLRRLAPLSLDATGRGVSRLEVARASVPAIVVELYSGSSGSSPLPPALRLVATHAATGILAAEVSTRVGASATTRRVVLAADGAFFLGEDYVLAVEGDGGVSVGASDFTVGSSADSKTDVRVVVGGGSPAQAPGCHAAASMDQVATRAQVTQRAARVGAHDAPGSAAPLTVRRSAASAAADAAAACVSGASEPTVALIRDDAASWAEQLPLPQLRLELLQLCRGGLGAIRGVQTVDMSAGTTRATVTIEPAQYLDPRSGAHALRITSGRALEPALAPLYPSITPASGGGAAAGGARARDATHGSGWDAPPPLKLRRASRLVLLEIVVDNDPPPSVLHVLARHRQLGVVVARFELKPAWKEVEMVRSQAERRAAERVSSLRDAMAVQERQIAARVRDDGQGSQLEEAKTVFKLLDRDRSGSIDARELRPALKRLGLAFSTEAAAAILARHDASRDGRLDVEEFAALVARLRDAEASLGEAELIAALRVLGVRASSKHGPALVSQYSTVRSVDGEPLVRLDEFGALVRDLAAFQQAHPPKAGWGAATRGSRSAPPPTAEKIGRVFHSFVPQQFQGATLNDEAVAIAFDRFDTDGTQYLSKSEVRAALRALGFADPTALGAAAQMQKFDRDGDIRLSLDEFRLLVQELRPAAAGFEPTHAEPEPEWAALPAQVRGRHHAASGAGGHFTAALLLEQDGAFLVGETYWVEVRAGHPEAAPLASGELVVGVEDPTVMHLESARVEAPSISATTLGSAPPPGQVLVTMESSVSGTEHWAAVLPLPAPVAFRVRRGVGEAGPILLEAETDASGGAPLDAAGMQIGESCTLEVPPSALIEGTSAIFTPTRDPLRVSLRVARLEAPVDLLVRAVRDGSGAAAPYDPPLPRRLRYRVTHRDSGAAVMHGELSPLEKAAGAAEARMRLPAGRGLYPGETYAVEVAYGSELEAEAAASSMAAALQEGTVSFLGAGEPELPYASAAWSLDGGDNMSALAESNARVIERLASVLSAHPGVSLEIRGATGEASTVPLLLATYLELDPERDVGEAMQKLASLRAQACAEALASRGISASRLRPVSGEEGGAAAAEGMARPCVAFKAIVSAVESDTGCYAARAHVVLQRWRPDGDDPPATVAISVARATARVEVQLAPASVHSPHWSNRMDLPSEARIIFSDPETARELTDAGPPTAGAGPSSSVLYVGEQYAVSLDDGGGGLYVAHEKPVSVQPRLGEVASAELKLRWRTRRAVPRLVAPPPPAGGAPLVIPRDLHFELRHFTSGELVAEGRVGGESRNVSDRECALPASAAMLPVGQPYLLSTRGGQGVEASQDVFLLQPALDEDDGPSEFRLELEMDDAVLPAVQPLRVRLTNPALPTTFRAALAIPNGIPFSIYLQAPGAHAGEPMLELVSQGAVYDAEALVSDGSILSGGRYTIEVPETPLTSCSRADVSVPLNPEDTVTVELPVSRASRQVELCISAPTGTRLPIGVPYRLFHRRKVEDAQEVEVRAARRRLHALLGQCTIGRPAITFAPVSSVSGDQRLQLLWSAEHPDQSVRERNERTLATIARVMRDYSSATLHIHAEVGFSGAALPGGLSEALGQPVDAAEEDVLDALALARARACSTKLVESGIDVERLMITSAVNGTGDHVTIDARSVDAYCAHPEGDGHRPEYALVHQGLTTKAGMLVRCSVGGDSDSALPVDETYRFEVAHWAVPQTRRRADELAAVFDAFASADGLLPSASLVAALEVLGVRSPAAAIVEPLFRSIGSQNLDRAGWATIVEQLDAHEDAAKAEPSQGGLVGVDNPGGPRCSLVGASKTFFVPRQSGDGDTIMSVQLQLAQPAVLEASVAAKGFA